MHAIHLYQRIFTDFISSHVQTCQLSQGESLLQQRTFHFRAGQTYKIPAWLFLKNDKATGTTETYKTWASNRSRLMVSCAQSSVLREVQTSKCCWLNISSSFSSIQIQPIWHTKCKINFFFNFVLCLKLDFISCSQNLLQTLIKNFLE